MDLDVIIYLVIGLVILIGLIVGIVLLNRYKNNKKKNDIISVFNEACKLHNITDYKIEYVKNDAYDFYYEDSKNIYYIKVVNNPMNKEICINNAIKWQLRTHGAVDEMNFVEGIDGLMRMDLKKNEKAQYKLYIVYPTARALLKVINECEMIFIYPDTDVYGTKVITYVTLKEKPELIEL